MSDMIGTQSRQAGFGRGAGFAGTKARGRPGSKDGEKKAIWVPMLNNASKGKDLAEKQLIVLGEMRLRKPSLVRDTQLTQHRE
jgi:hypothetical protein